MRASPCLNARKIFGWQNPSDLRNLLIIFFENYVTFRLLKVSGVERQPRVAPISIWYVKDRPPEIWTCLRGLQEGNNRRLSIVEPEGS